MNDWVDSTTRPCATQRTELPGSQRLINTQRGLQLTVSLPTGSGSEGVDAGVTALVKKSFARANAYLGLREEFLSEYLPGGRDTLFSAVLGASFAPGAPSWLTYGSSELP